MKNPVELIPIDFTKPWWRVIADQKMLAGTMMLVIVLRDLIPVLIPFLVTYTLEKESWYFFVGIVVLWVCGEIGGILQRRLVAQFQLQCIHSILHSAHQYLLAIDPQYHVKRSSGVILAKIERAARGYEEVLDQIALEFVPLAIGIAGMIIVLSHYSLLLGGVVFVCLGTMLVYGYYFASYRCQKWENDFIATDDDFKAVAFENLAQVHLIRATFATDYIRDKLTAKAERNSVVEKALWLSYARVSGVLSMLHTTSILMVLGYFVYCVQHGIVSLAFATGLVLAYIQSTRQLTKILKPFRHYMRGYAAIKDLFEFLPQFGHQTITVFGNDELVADKNTHIAVVAQDLLFGYGKAPIFDHHMLRIESGTQQRNKLYGIIGDFIKQ